jgi:hypothetical protein
MKRALLILALTIAAALTIGAAPAAAAGTCSNFNPVGPIIGGGVDMGWAANCNVQYDVQVVPQYESGGTWHRATKGGTGAISTFSSPYSAGSHSDDNLFQALDQTPYCSFNWRGSYGVFNHATGDNLVSTIGPELHKTC